jgi:hypothetical protein
LDSSAAITRPAMSVTPPAANGMMIFTGLLGYCCAKAEPEIASAAQIAANRIIILIEVPSLFRFSLC